MYRPAHKNVFLCFWKKFPLAVTFSKFGSCTRITQCANRLFESKTVQIGSREVGKPMRESRTIKAVRLLAFWARPWDEATENLPGVHIFMVRGLRDTGFV
jgi:hypothetical protein